MEFIQSARKRIISVIMPAYNAEQYIGQAIQSVLAQSCKNWELIVVDDGSTDRTSQILAGFSDPRIRVHHQPNGGEACARNTALDLIQGKFLAFLDSDDVFLPEHLKLTSGYLNDHPEVGGVYTDGFYIDQTGSRLKPLSSRRRGPFEGDIFEEVMRSSDVFGAPVCVVLRSDVIKQNALRFDSEIVIGPDWDFLNQFAEVSPFGYVKEPTCLYRVHQTNISVRTGIERRMKSLARCREKTIKMKRFMECSAESRIFVFYDLLINLLQGNIKRRSEIVDWPEFTQLPHDEQARLLRLMTSKSLVEGEQDEMIAGWLQKARSLNPRDLTGGLLSAIYAIHPGLCRILLKLRGGYRSQKEPLQPFHDLLENLTQNR
jgi:glycosyltransferase involved in cell wall biosynthesis